MAEAKPATASSVIAASEPPATITSASPYSIILAASPIECVPVVHAVTMATFGPFNPYIIDKLPEIILIIVPGIKKGETFLCPPSSKTSLVDSMRSIPPIPEPMDTPILSDVFSSIAKPESFIASIPAANPY